MGNGRVRVTLADAKDLDLEHFDDLELPESTSLEFPLIDHDAGECRITDAAELRERYIDNNIVRIMPPGLKHGPLVIDFADLERQESEVHYSHDHVLHLALDQIALSGGRAPRHFMQTGGLIFPIDDTRNVALNPATVPFLAAVRRQFQADLEAISTERIEMAEIVSAFGNAIGMNAGVPEPF